MYVKLETTGCDEIARTISFRFRSYDGENEIAPPGHVARILLKIVEEHEFEPITDELTRAICKKLSYYGLDPDDNFQTMWLNDHAHKHWLWVDAMGWHKTRILEKLALVASEVGEYYADDSTEELADIALRLMDIAYGERVEIKTDVLIYADHKTFMVEFAKIANAVRRQPYDIADGINKLLSIVITWALMRGEDLLALIDAKMEKNRSNGSRGRTC